VLLCTVLLCTSNCVTVSCVTAYCVTANFSFLGAKPNYSFRRVPTADTSPFGPCHVMGTVLSVAHLLSVCNVLQVPGSSCLCILAGACVLTARLMLDQKTSDVLDTTIRYVEWSGSRVVRTPSH
jgi:hypothetical protein